MKLDEQQRLQIFCAALQGVAADMTHMVKPEKVVETAIELAEQAIAAIMSGEHFWAAYQLDNLGRDQRRDPFLVLRVFLRAPTLLRRCFGDIQAALLS